jgi:hypothetical protein
VLGSGSHRPFNIVKIGSSDAASGDEATDDGTDDTNNEAREAEESTEAVNGHGADEAFARHGQ